MLFPQIGPKGDIFVFITEIKMRKISLIRILVREKRHSQPSLLVLDSKNWMQRMRAENI
jgi:hypothetical protein